FQAGLGGQDPGCLLEKEPPTLFALGRSALPGHEPLPRHMTLRSWLSCATVTRPFRSAQEANAHRLANPSELHLLRDGERLAVVWREKRVGLVRPFTDEAFAFGIKRERAAKLIRGFRQLDTDAL